MFCYKCKMRTNVERRIEVASRDNNNIRGFLRICQQCENKQINVALGDIKPDWNRVAQLNNNRNPHYS